MTQTITGLFDTHTEAMAAVAALRKSGVPESDISVVANNGDEAYSTNSDTASEAADDAGKGAGIGALVGGTGGLLTGLGLMAIPGVGPVVAAGWLVATAAGAVAGAAVGGAAGGLIGAMTENGIPERDAHIYAEVCDGAARSSRLEWTTSMRLRHAGSLARERSTSTRASRLIAAKGGTALTRRRRCMTASRSRPNASAIVFEERTGRRPRSSFTQQRR